MTLLYPDVSNVQWGLPFTSAGATALTDFLVAAKASGMSGAVHKVSQGQDFADPYWPMFRAWCESNAFPWLGYHYVDTSDPQSQARNFASNNGGSWAMLDGEKGSGYIANLWNVTNAFNDVGASVSLNYLPRWYWNSIGEPDLSELTANQIALVSSDYSDGGAGAPLDIYHSIGGDTGPGWQPYGGCQVTAWQFTESAIIGGVIVDCNAYGGANLNDLFTGNIF